MPIMPRIIVATLSLLFFMIVGPFTAFAKISSPTNDRMYTVKPGQTLYSILKNQNFNEQQVRTVLQQNILPRNYPLAPGDKYRVTTWPKSKRTEIKVYDRQQDQAYLFWKEPKNLAGSSLEMQVFNTKIISKEGRVRGSLISSISEQVPDKLVAYRFMDAFMFHHNPKSLQRGAHFALTVEEKYDGEHFVKYGEITYAELEVNGKVVKRYFVPFAQGGAFADPSISLSTNEQRPLYAPVNYVRISSVFQSRRFHPIKHRKKPHMGVDFELPEGEDVLAAQEGQVLRFGRNRAAGRFVVVDHGNGLESYYNHMSYISENIYRGKFVRAGELLGFIGCTGYCTKPHLHFAVKKRGQFVDPLKYTKPFPYSKKPTIEKFLAEIRKTTGRG